MEILDRNLPFPVMANSVTLYFWRELFPRKWRHYPVIPRDSPDLCPNSVLEPPASKAFHAHGTNPTDFTTATRQYVKKKNENMLRIHGPGG